MSDLCQYCGQPMPIPAHVCDALVIASSAARRWKGDPVIYETIGTCSLCGGAVQAEPSYWGLPPYLACTVCGARAKHAPERVIEMDNPLSYGGTD